MSLNKRSLKKDARPEPPLEDRLRALEKHIKTRRGANRRAAFDGLVTHDVDRAIALVRELVKAASGKNQAELGGLLASTGLPHLVEAAARGSYGDVAVWEWAPSSSTTPLVDALPALLPTLSGAQVEKRARALGIVPLELPPSPEAERALVAIVDDERVRREIRAQALEALLLRAPWNVWTRRETGLVGDDVVVCAGLATRYTSAEQLDVVAFERAIAALPADVRKQRMRAAGFPKSADRFPAAIQVRLLVLALDNPFDDEMKAGAARALAALRTADADDAVLARADAFLPATVTVCERLSHDEARAILGPLVRASEAARDAVLASRAAGFVELLDDAVAVLAVDPVGACALLARMAPASERARLEIQRALDAADVAACTPLLAGLCARPLLAPSRAAASQLALGDALMQLAVAHDLPRDFRVKLLSSLAARAGAQQAALIEAALRVADV